MNSKEALEKMGFYVSEELNKDDFIECYETIEKDLDRLERFKKIDKKDLLEFIEKQIKYTLNEQSWLVACNCELSDEEKTKYLIKIKEWLENEK